MSPPSHLPPHPTPLGCPTALGLTSLHPAADFAAMFTLAITWKQPRCSSTDEWVKKSYIYTTEYYSTINRNAFESVLMRWVSLEPVTHSCLLTSVKTASSIPWHFSITFAGSSSFA